MILEFIRKLIYGRELYYPANDKARAIVDLTGRKCLKTTEIAQLIDAGFKVEVI